MNFLGIRRFMYYLSLVLAIISSIMLLPFDRMAHAKDLSATTNWAVSRMPTPEAGSPYCTLARGFSDSVVLTFAINEQDESSLAIDFQKKSFDSKRSYSIKLAAGLDLNRSFDVQAASSSALILRLGRDKAFFEALKRAKFLGLNIDQRQYNFDFSDFSEGMIQIQACLDTFMLDTQALVLSEQLSANENKLQEFERAIRELNRENADLKSNLRVTQAELSDSRLRLDQTLSRADQARLRAERAEQALEERPVIEVEVPVPAPAPAPAVSTINQDDIRLKELQSRLRAMLKQVSSLKQENASLQDELVKLANVPQEKQVPIVSSPQISLKEFDAVKRQLQDKTTALELAQKRISNILSSKNDLEKKVQILNQKIVAQERAIQLSARASMAQDTKAKVMASEVIQAKSRVREGQQSRQDVDTSSLVEPPIFQPDTTARTLNNERSEYRDSSLITGEEDPVFTQIVNNPVPIKDLRQEESQEVFKEQGLRASRHTLAQSRYTTARERRVEQAKQARMQTMEQPYNKREATSMPADTAPVIMNRSRPKPIFDGPGEGQERVEATYRSSEIRSGRLSLSEASDIPLYTDMTPTETSQKDSLEDVPVQALLPEPVTLSASKSGEVEALLAEANIPVSTALKRLDDISNTNFAAYQWNSGDTFGSAEVTAISSENAFDILSQAYLERTKRRCDGEFASIPTTGFSEDSTFLSGYDIACVSGVNQGAVASILFLVKNNKFITIAFEASASNIEKAMRVRDQLGQSLGHL